MLITLLPWCLGRQGPSFNPHHGLHIIQPPVFYPHHVLRSPLIHVTRYTGARGETLKAVKQTKTDNRQH